MAKTLIKMTLLHIVISYGSVPLFWMVIDKFYPPIWAYILAPVYTTILIPVEFMRLVMAIVGLGWEWSWMEPAKIIGIYTSAMTLGTLCIIGFHKLSGRERM
jgi:hypothetical protein